MSTFTRSHARELEVEIGAGRNVTHFQTRRAADQYDDLLALNKELVAALEPLVRSACAANIAGKALYGTPVVTTARAALAKAKGTL